MFGELQEADVEPASTHLSSSKQDAAPESDASLPPSGPQIPREVILSILSHLSLPPNPKLIRQTSTLRFLSEHFSSIPPTLAVSYAVEGVTSPRERSGIKEIKGRRMIWARGDGNGVAAGRNGDVVGGLRAELTAQGGGWRRWPLLWEKMGGDPLGPSTFRSPTTSSSHPSLPTITHPTRAQDEHTWTTQTFPPSRTPHGTGNLASFLSAQEEEREAAEVRSAKLRERRAEREEEELGEEFDDESDDESGSYSDSEGVGGKVVKNVRDEEEADGAELDWGPGSAGRRTEEDVVRAFERRLLELFLDGKDTIDYTPIDFPLILPPPDPLVVQDLEDAYFAEEEAEEDAGQIGKAIGDGRLAEGEYDY